MSVIVDPNDRNVALVDGEVAYAIRFGPPMSQAPTVADLKGMKIIGYGNFIEGEE